MNGLVLPAQQQGVAPAMSGQRQRARKLYNASTSDATWACTCCFVLGNAKGVGAQRQPWFGRKV